MIIVLTGYRRCGKDTAANFFEEYFQKENLPYKRIAFADKLKDYICSILDISKEELEKLKKTNEEFKIYEKNFTMRDLLISCANNLRNILSNDIWARSVEKDMDFNEIILITDLRFKDELKFLENKSKELNKPLLIFKVISNLDSCIENQDESEIKDIKEKYILTNIKDNLNLLKSQIFMILDDEIKGLFK